MCRSRSGWDGVGVADISVRLLRNGCEDLTVLMCYAVLRSGDRIPAGAQFSAPVQTGLGVHQVSCVMGTGSLSWG